MSNENDGLWNIPKRTKGEMILHNQNRWLRPLFMGSIQEKWIRKSSRKWEWSILSTVRVCAMRL